MIFSLAMAAVTLVMSVLSLLEKGYLFNNAYIYASEQERKTMNKTPYYRQSGIVFGLLGVMFLLMAGAMYWHAGWLWAVAFAVALATLIYAIASTVRQLKAPPKP